MEGPAHRFRVGTIFVREDEVEFSATRAGGPGGQNVNKVASKVELRFPFERNESMPETVKERLRNLAKNKLDANGALVVTSQKTRDQLQNLADAWEKLEALVRSATIVPKKRKATRPTFGSVQRRLGEKKARGDTKKNRSQKGDD